jgi:hypothetical protein
MLLRIVWVSSKVGKWKYISIKRFWHQHILASHQQNLSGIRIPRHPNITFRWTLGSDNSQFLMRWWATQMLMWWQLMRLLSIEQHFKVYFRAHYACFFLINRWINCTKKSLTDLLEECLSSFFKLSSCALELLEFSLFFLSFLDSLSSSDSRHIWLCSQKWDLHCNRADHCCSWPSLVTWPRFLVTIYTCLWREP